MSDTLPNPPSDDEGHLVTEGEPVPTPREKPMGFLDHLEELRWTLIKCAIVFAIFVTAIAYRLDDASTLLNWPLEKVRPEFPHMKMEIVTNSPMSVFTVIIDICLIGGIVLSLPFWIYFLGRFISPALNDKELRVIVPTGLSAFALFLGGAGFGYYLLTPNTIRVAFELNEMLGYTVMWTADKYYSLLMWMVLGMGAAFEFPLLVVLAVYMGLIEVATLRKYRRHAIVVMFIIAAVVTPTPDPFNQCLFALPLIVLYEIAILVASRITARRNVRG
ncbi:twin-arginine translocase subunit TatC [Oleiharenicola sp. Vm1]|uniref:twin-arginine translocase subunit TatC n=1 Tax=Oleiharenicola sp. Vm1 TaxID=3398393 RepID=UPI0039F61C23